MTSDRRGRLISDPFAYRVTKDRRVIVGRGGRVVSTIAGAKAERLIAAIDAAEDDETVQRLLARATGHYKHGNELGGKDAPGKWREMPSR